MSKLKKQKIKIYASFFQNYIYTGVGKWWTIERFRQRLLFHYYLSYLETRSVTFLFHKIFISP